MIPRRTVLLLTLLFLQQIHAFAGKPNIILIMTDDQGYGDLSVHGSPDVATPNVDRLRA